MLLGVAQRDEQLPFSGIYSADEVEGMALNTLNKLIEFIDVLARYKAKLQADAPLNEKAAILKELLSAVYSDEGEQSWDLLVLQKVLDTLIKPVSYTHLTLPTNREV